MARASGAEKRRRSDDSSGGDSDSHVSKSHATSSHQGGSLCSRGDSPSVSYSVGGSSSNRSVRDAPPRFDGNRDPAEVAALADVQLNRNIDGGMAMWSHVKGQAIKIPRRPGPSKLGKEVLIGLNTFNVVQFPEVPVYQYSVLMGSGAEKRALVTKLWHAKALKEKLPKPQRWIFDGDKIAWSTEKLDGELRVNVDLDTEQGRPKKECHANTHRVVLRPNTTVKFDQLKLYLAGKCDFDTKCLESINMLDHLLREHPSSRLTAIKRSFFQAGERRFDLGGGIEAFKGVYQSMRIAHQPNNNHCLTVNVDVANGTFWTAGKLSSAIMAALRLRGENEIAGCMDSDDKFRQMKRLRKLHVQTKHRGEVDNYIIDKFIAQNAHEYKFTTRDPSGKEVRISLADYYQHKYKTRLQHPEWPVVSATKRNSVLPIEVLHIKENQRYNFKLDDKQTSNMIKFAVTPPKERLADIQRGVQMLNWAADPFLKGYGLNISQQSVVTKGRLLQNPKVAFANGETDPRTSGRWDLKGKKFLLPNTKPLESWGVCIMPIRGVDKNTVDRFMQTFCQSYTAHGGKIAKQPEIHVASNPDPAKAIEDCYNKTGNKFQARPQIIVVILADKNTVTYGRIKKSAECRYGIVTQCMQYSNVQKCQPQYISNVLMKFNAKLGGVTNRAYGPQTKGGLFKVPTMIVGADISHPAPASQGLPSDEQKMSTAAITVSMDRNFTRYASLVNSNGFRVEIMNTENWTKLWKPLIQAWVSDVGGGRMPQQIIYFRDGVSEGQFSSVINQEVADMKALLATNKAAADIKFLVIVASKRHHIRFFPKDQQGQDRNGNPLPGSMVESSVTHPYENDFFLCSHSAIKGTARPTHYHVLLNELELPNEQIQTMIYEHCYQYIRATTPVSLFPAVYYADIAALRAKHHDSNFGGGSHERSRTGSEQGRGDDTSDSTPSTVADLMPMPTTAGIHTAMWYI